MNKTTYPTFPLTNFILLAALLMPISASATMVERVTAGDQPVDIATGACSKVTNIDRITQNVNQAKNDLAKGNPTNAEKNLEHAYNELQNIQKSYAGKVVERITITHGPKLENPGYLDTGTAYYSPSMQDMRLLHMASANLKAGESHAACSKLSAVRFPYFSANAQLAVNKLGEDVHRALINLQSHKSNAMVEMDKFTVTASTYASIFHP